MIIRVPSFHNNEGGQLSFLPMDSESDGEFFAPMRTEHPNLVLVSFANLRNLSQIFPKNSGIEKKVGTRNHSWAKRRCKVMAKDTYYVHYKYVPSTRLL
jgi:hypothetical protein